MGGGGPHAAQLGFQRGNALVRGGRSRSGCHGRVVEEPRSQLVGILHFELHQ
jgi:hypothetical protein